MREYIEFSEITGFSKLFIDYIKNFEKVSEFYSGDPFREESWEAIQNSINNQPKVKNKLIKILEKQNTNPKAVENIKYLKGEDCFAIVTGQQPGIFTGPIYTIYKALTAIKLSESLKEKFGYNFVPVFWIESNDHDFEEVKYVNFINKNKSLSSIKYNPVSEFINKPIGEILFDGEIDNLLEIFYDQLNDNDFKPDIIELLSKCYTKHTSIACSFGMLMSILLKEKGLIMLDPSDKELKSLAADIFLKIAENWKELNTINIQNYSKLKELGYKPEIKIRENSLNLFYHISGERLPISVDNNNFIIGNNKLKMKRQELLDNIIENPENFSPNVLTRPIMQDFLLPTISYVAGPTEIGYFSQVSETYKFTEVKMPIIFPRVSATLINNKIKNILKRSDISPSRLFTEKDLLKDKLTEKFIGQEITELFNKNRKNIEETHKEISSAAESVDITLKHGVDKSFGKIFYQFSKIKDRFEKKIQEKHNIIKTQTEETNDFLFPNGKIQERKLNVFTFISMYGVKFVLFLFKEIDIYSKSHQLIFLEKLLNKE